MLRQAVLISALAGCGGYQPGALVQGPGPAPSLADQRATIGCLDLAVARRPDYDASTVLEYRFGNRCNRSIEVDLQQVAVIGRLDDGREVELLPYDPDGELRPARLAGRHASSEAIAYQTSRSVTQVCVDAASIVHAQPARWLCLGGSMPATTDAPAARDLEEAP